MCGGLPESLDADAVQRFAGNGLEEVLRQVEFLPDVGVKREEVRHGAQTQERTDDGRLNVVVVVVVTQQVATGR